MSDEEIQHEILVENVRDGHVEWEEVQQEHCLARLFQRNEDAKMEWLKYMVDLFEQHELNRKPSS